jgi:hypothetical protein
LTTHSNKILALHAGVLSEHFVLNLEFNLHLNQKLEKDKRLTCLRLGQIRAPTHLATPSFPSTPPPGQSIFLISPSQPTYVPCFTSLPGGPHLSNRGRALADSFPHGSLCPVGPWRQSLLQPPAPNLSRGSYGIGMTQTNQALLSPI